MSCLTVEARPESTKITNKFNALIKSLDKTHTKKEELRIAKKIDESKKEWILKLMKKGKLVIHKLYQDYINSIFIKIEKELI